MLKSDLIDEVVAPAAAVSFGLAPAALGTWAGKEAVIVGGTDFAAQMATNHGDFSKLDFVSIAGSTAGRGLGSGVSRMTAGIAGKTIGGKLLGMGTRATLNSAGSGLIGGGVTLGQNAFNSGVLNQKIGLWDGVKNNAKQSTALIQLQGERNRDAGASINTQ